MTSIEIGVIRSKVKVTVTLRVKIVSDQYFVNGFTNQLDTSNVHFPLPVDDPYRNWGHLVKVTVTVNVNIVSDQ